MKTVIHMAAECMLFEELGPDEFEAALVKFAELVRADEREQCAQICEQYADVDTYENGVTLDFHAKLIRERSNK